MTSAFDRLPYALAALKSPCSPQDEPFVYANSAAERLTGRSAAELGSLPFLGLCDGSQEDWLALIHQSADEGRCVDRAFSERGSALLFRFFPLGDGLCGCAPIQTRLDADFEGQAFFIVRGDDSLLFQSDALVNLVGHRVDALTDCFSREEIQRMSSSVGQTLPLCVGGQPIALRIGRLLDDVQPVWYGVCCKTADVSLDQTLQSIVERMAGMDYDLLALLYPQTDCLRYVRYSPSEARFSISDELSYQDCTSSFVESSIAPESKEEAREMFDVSHVVGMLENHRSYSRAFTVCVNGCTYRKRWKFFYLDACRSCILVARTDETELFLETEQQRENLRTALAQAEHASHAKSDFLSRMSHEIRTPMNAIIGMSALAAQCVNDPDQVADCISKVGISARFLLSLINDILDMSRIESGKVTVRHERFPFEELIGGINTIIYEQAVEKGVDYDCVMTSFTDPFYLGDAMKLQQVLVNLLGNAVKFTPRGGKVQLIVHQEREENGEVPMTFTVNDTGVGISPEFQKHMFEPFEQLQTSTTSPFGGTGLGLAICHNLVRLMNGHIAVNSIEGVGSEFTVSLRLGVCEDRKVSRAKSDVPFDKLGALVVDDDVMICEHTEAILRDMGIRAEWVDSGRKAVETVRQRFANRHHFDVILIDWKMPEMDGIETTRQIRQIVGPDVTIIVMTAYDWSSIEHEAKAAGVNLLISKPLFKSSLTSAFEKIYSDKKDAQPEPPVESYDFTGRSILLVEDHILNVEVAKRLLESRHAHVTVAENGLASIEAFTTAPDGTFDAILMDIRMPVMDGLTAARAIRQLKKAGAKTIPIIAMSANAFDEDVEKSKAAGMNLHLAKPIEPRQLYAALQELLSHEA